MTIHFEESLNFAKELDRKDSLSGYRDEFLFPRDHRGEPCIYLTGNSLGLQPKAARRHVLDELDKWSELAVEGHFEGKAPWFSYDELVTGPMSSLVGAKPLEVIAMNSLTVNLHLMMVSFYAPTSERYRIVIEGGAFPSDHYAVASQVQFHGFDPREAIVELVPREGESTLRTEDIVETIEREGDSVALVLLGNPNYLTGQAFDVPTLCKASQKKGCLFGLDLAHGVGNLELQLHDWGVDFAAWCTYKYLNAGPGSLAGCFVHERYAGNLGKPRFEGWWGNTKKNRFEMRPQFDPTRGAAGWQLSNPPILQMAALKASLDIFERVGISELRRKSTTLTGYLEFLLNQIPKTFCEIVTPTDFSDRGAQLSLRVKEDRKSLMSRLRENGVICDFREPDILRAAPTPMYNTFEEVYRFVEILKRGKAF